MVSKIIIKVKDNCVNEVQALEIITYLINQGKISEDSKGIKHYCWMTLFPDYKVMVNVTPKRNSDSDIFTIYRNSKQLKENGKH